MATSTNALPQSRSTIISVPRNPERVRTQPTAAAPAQVDSFVPSQPTDMGFLQQMRAQSLALKADPQAVAVRGARVFRVLSARSRRGAARAYAGAGAISLTA